MILLITTTVKTSNPTIMKDIRCKKHGKTDNNNSDYRLLICDTVDSCRWIRTFPAFVFREKIILRMEAVCSDF
jgi:hypothetical protein